MAIASAPVLSGNLDLVPTLFKVTMAWPSWQSTTPSLPGWHLLRGSELGLSTSQLNNGVYSNANAEAIVAAATYKGMRTLAVGFRGTNDNDDWRHDFQNVNVHYDLFSPLVTAVNAAARRGEFDLLLITGHSLGGAMTQMFMADYAGLVPTFGITTGSPGYLQEQPVADSRLINYQVSDDPIVYLGDNRATVGQLLSGPLGFLAAGTLSSALSRSFGFPPSLFTDSIPFLTRNYLDRGTNILLQVDDHPATPPASLLELIGSYNSTAHDFATYEAGLARTNANPFDLGVGRRGSSGNDALFGTTGADSINGGAGFDTLYLHVNRSDATLTMAAGALTTVSSAASGTDSLASIERIAFADRRLAFDLAADQSAGKTARIIGAAFDAEALLSHKDWVSAGIEAFDAGAGIVDVCEVAVKMMQTTSNESFVSKVFSNVVGREPSGAELQQFTGMLTGSGGTMSQAQLLQMAAYTDMNITNIGLIGLQTSGLEFA